MATESIETRMTKEDALKCLESGHAIWSVKGAEEIAEALGVSCPRSLVLFYESERHPLGVTMYHGPGQGVWSLDLSRHVATALGVADKARGFLGRGSQAQEYARLVRERLEEEV